MSRRQMGWVALVIGLVLILGSLGADALGFGGFPGMGWKQTLGFAAGAAIGAVGVFLFWQKPER